MTKPILKSLPIVATALGDKLGIEVRIEGNQAFTDCNKTIVIPCFDPSDKTTHEVTYGYIAHECGHVRFSDRFPCEKPLLHEMLNTIEDFRIEREMGAMFPGTVSMLGSLAKHLFGEWQLANKQLEPVNVLLNYVLFRCLSRLKEQEFLDNYADQYEPLMIDAFSRGLVVKINGLLSSRLEKVESTLDCKKLAEAVLSVLADEYNNAQQIQNTQDQQQQQEQDASGQSGTPGSDQKNSDEPQSGSSSEPTNEGNGTSTKQGSDEQTTAVQLSNIESVFAAHAEDIIVQDKSSMAQAFLNDQAQSSNHQEKIVQPLHEVKLDLDGYSGSLDNALAKSNRLRSRLLGLLQQHTLAKTRRSRTGKRLAVKRLADVAVGDDRCFLKKDQKILPNAAVHLVIDRSSSMADEERIEVAREAAFSLSSALDAVPKVNVATSAFPLGENGILSIQSHNETSRKAASSYGALTANGLTPMAEALWYAAIQLSRQKQERKVIIVLTDGRPAGNANNGKGALENAQETVQRCLASGIDVYGIGIKHPAVTKFIPDSSVIHDVNDLPNTLFDLARRAILG